MPECIVEPVSGSPSSYIVTCGDVTTIPLTGNAKRVNVPAAGIPVAVIAEKPAASSTISAAKSAASVAKSAALNEAPSGTNQLEVANALLLQITEEVDKLSTITKNSSDEERKTAWKTAEMLYQELNAIDDIINKARDSPEKEKAKIQNNQMKLNIATVIRATINKAGDTTYKKTVKAEAKIKAPQSIATRIEKVTKKKGGRRTHRTHRKRTTRTHQKRTHRRRTNNSKKGYGAFL